MFKMALTIMWARAHTNNTRVLYHPHCSKMRHNDVLPHQCRVHK